MKRLIRFTLCGSQLASAPHSSKTNPHRRHRLPPPHFEPTSTRLGELPASQLLDFFLEELAPAVYNQAIHDAQTHLTQRLADLPGELYAEPFPYWPRQLAKRRR